MTSISKRVTLAAALLMLVAGLAACASGRGASAQSPVAEAAHAAASPFAKIDLGANAVDVRKSLGEPDSSRAYQIWKAWVPFYFGPDTARTDWAYERQGRVVFARNRYSGRLTVIDVVYDAGLGG